MTLQRCRRRRRPGPRPAPALAHVLGSSPCTSAPLHCSTRLLPRRAASIIDAPGRRHLVERRKPVGPSSPTPVATPPPLSHRRPHPRSSPHRRSCPRSSPNRWQLAGASHIGGSSIWRRRRRPFRRPSSTPSLLYLQKIVVQSKAQYIAGYHFQPPKNWTSQTCCIGLS